MQAAAFKGRRYRSREAVRRSLAWLGTVGSGPQGVRAAQTERGIDPVAAPAFRVEKDDGDIEIPAVLPATEAPSPRRRRFQLAYREKQARLPE